MLLAFDAGNSSLEVALLGEGTVLCKADAPSKNPGKEEIKELIRKVVQSGKPDGVVISCVVQELTDLLKEIGKEITDNPLFVDAFLDLGYEIDMPRKASLGADIVATCAGAIALYGDCIVVDTGTATTFQVLKDKKFIGCVIASGLYMGMQALYDFTSLLPKITVKKPDRVVNLDTISCMQSGTFYGHAGMIEGILARIKKETGDNLKVVATGGAADMINEVLDTPFDQIDNDLIFKGLDIIYQRNAGLVRGNKK